MSQVKLYSKNEKTAKMNTQHKSEKRSLAIVG